MTRGTSLATATQAIPPEATRASAPLGLRLLPLAVAALTFLAFLPALDGQFIHWDDDVNFLNNLHYRGLGWAQLKWMFTSTLLGHYIPLTWVTLGLNYVLGGMDPWGYHLGNLLLHAGSAALFYLVARRLLAAGFQSGAPSPRGEEGSGEGTIAVAWGAAVAALVFGVHPLRVESVAWVTERRDVLCGWFYLLAVLAYLWGTAAGGVLRGRWRWLSLVAFAAALLSKAMAMTLPLTLLLLDVYPLRRSRLGWRALVAEKLPHALLSVIGAGVAMLALARSSPWTGYEVYGVRARLAMVGYSLWFYPWAMLWPEGLSPLYELPARVDPLEPQFMLPIVGFAAVTAALLLLRRRCPGALAAWAGSAIALAPISGIVHAGHQLAHDRYSYLSGLGLAALAGAGVTWVLLGWRRARVRGWVGVVVAGAAVLGVAGWGAGTWRQSGIWHDSEALWRAAVDADARCAICQNNLGAALMEGSPPGDPRLEEAEAHLRRAVSLNPAYADAYRSLATLLSNERRDQEAEGVLRALMREFPHLSDGPSRLASLLASRARFVEAIVLLRHSLQLDPSARAVQIELGHALTNRGIELAREGRSGDAAALFREAASILPGEAGPFESLGRLLVEQGKGEEALAPLGHALRLSPGRPSVRFWLAGAYLLAGEVRRADVEIATLREMDPGLAGRVKRKP